MMLMCVPPYIRSFKGDRYETSWLEQESVGTGLRCYCLIYLLFTKDMTKQIESKYNSTYS